MLPAVRAAGRPRHQMQLTDGSRPGTAPGSGQPTGGYTRLSGRRTAGAHSSVAAVPVRPGRVQRCLGLSDACRRAPPCTQAPANHPSRPLGPLREGYLAPSFPVGSLPGLATPLPAMLRCAPHSRHPRFSRPCGRTSYSCIAITIGAAAETPSFFSSSLTMSVASSRVSLQIASIRSASSSAFCKRQSEDTDWAVLPRA